MKYTNSLLSTNVTLFLERFSYFGFKAILVFYLLSETIGFEQQDAIVYYGFLVFFVSLMPGVNLALIKKHLNPTRGAFLGMVFQCLGMFFLFLMALILESHFF